MVTAILLVTSIVIAVLVYSCCIVSGQCSRIEEQESYKWARLWNEQWNCDNNCKMCGEKQFCELKDTEVEA